MVDIFFSPDFSGTMIIQVGHGLGLGLEFGIDFMVFNPKTFLAIQRPHAGHAMFLFLFPPMPYRYMFIYVPLHVHLHASHI